MAEAISEADYWDRIYGGKLKAEPGGHTDIRHGAMGPLIEGPRVIDIGAGYAGFCHYLIEHHPDWYVVALDFSDRARLSSGYAPYIVGDATDLLFADDEFDTAIISCTLEYVPDDMAALREALRVAPRLVAVIPNGKHETCSQLREYDPEGVARMLHEVVPDGMVEVNTEHGFILAVADRATDA